MPAGDPPRHRGTRPDAEQDGVAYLFKACDELHLTYQIRLLTYLAVTRGFRVCIEVRPGTRLSPALAAFVAEHEDVLTVERED